MAVDSMTGRRWLQHAAYPTFLSMHSGVVLAGGRSSRFGDADKAIEPLAGVPMVRRVAERVAAATDEVVVNCRDDQADAIRSALGGLRTPTRIAVDPVPDEGPLAGMKNSLAAIDGEYAAVVACDMPFVDPDFLDYLFERAAGSDGAVPRPDEYFEVTQAVYQTDAMLAACESALADGERKPLAPIRELDVVVVGGPEVATHADPTTFRNVNTREEFVAVAELLREHGDDRVVGDEAGQDDAVDPV